MRKTLALSAAISLAVVGFVAGRMTAPTPDGYIDVSAATPEFREKLSDPEYVAWLSKLKFNKPDPADSKRQTMSLPDGVPPFPLGLLYAPDADYSWPDIALSRGQEQLGEAKAGWTVINLWASWCAPCIIELPNIERAKASYEKFDVTLLALNVDPMRRDTQEVAQAIFDKRGLQNMRPLVTEGGDIDKTIKAFGMSQSSVSLPINIIYAPGGKPYAMFLGGPSSEDQAVWNTPEMIAFFKALANSES